jgi:hypothetical protein
VSTAPIHEGVVGLRPELLGTVGDQTERDGRVQMRTGVVGDDHTGEDREAPADVHHQEAAVEALVLDERYVRHDAGTEQDEHCGAHQLREEIYTDIVHVDLPIVSSSAPCCATVDGSSQGGHFERY